MVLMTENLRFRGTVKWFNSQKGYGYISRDSAGGDVFVHHSAIDGKGFRFLTEGEPVEFEVKTTPKGNQALEVKRLNPPQTPEEELIAMLQAAKRRTFTILLMGRTGVGKSSTVNTLLGSQVAPVGKFEPTTINVTSYHSTIYEVPCIVVDTPGLCDDLPERGNDQAYLALIQEKIRNVDSLWFVTRIDDTRVTSDEMRGISLISRALTPKVWNTAVIVFTFSDKLTSEAFDEFMGERSRLIRNEIAKHTGSEIAAKIPSVAVSNMSNKNPDGSLWLGELYTKVLVRLSKRGALPFLIATASRIIRLPIDKSITGDANTDLSSQHKSSNLSSNPTSTNIIDVLSITHISAVVKI
jgi:cold shock CspA family protein/GTP-binding protein EngB required for normal cell division